MVSNFLRTISQQGLLPLSVLFPLTFASNYAMAKAE